jgi:serine/threonine protein kinase
VPIGPGTQLGQYVVQDFIGEGAMGRVYRAYHPDLERVGAVKVLNGLSGDPQSVARFRREAQAIAKMRHPNIVNVFDFGQYEGTPYMIVEYVEGGNLSARLQHGRLEPDRVIKYLTEIGEALDYAHSRGIVHRDVKPANILMTNADTPILADFGLVKLMESSSIKSMTGMATGTPAYMAPEQVSGEEVGPASDRYSFAILAYQMLTGRIPFSEGGVLEVMYAQVNRMPPAPSSVNPELSSAVDAVLMKGMAKDPKARWAACGEMVAALRKALEAKGAQPAAAPSHTVIMPPPVPQTAAPPPPPPAFASPPPQVPQSPVTGSFAPPPANAPELRYVMGRAGVSRIGSRWTRRIFVALGVIGALLVLGTAGGLVYAALQPAVSVTPASASPGDQVQVTARNVPAGQEGTIQAFGNSQDFTASGGGVTMTIAIPVQTPPGDYTISVCWDGACHASTSVHVLPGVASPSVQPSPSPSPTAQATPLTLAVNPRAGVVPGRTVLTVTATGLAPGGARIGVAQGTLRQFWDALVPASGTLSKKIVLSATQPVWAVGTAFVTVCDVQYKCTAAVDITVT